MAENIHTKERLKKLQSLSLERKILITQARIIEWYKHYKGQVYISFSGGKDSTVLLHIARKIFPNIPAVFVDTGLEYPEIRKFVNSFNNTIILRPKMRFDEVIKKYGYPMISKEVSEKVYNARRGGSCKDDFILNTPRESRNNHAFSMVKWSDLLNADFELSNLCCNIMKKQPCKQYEKETGNKPIIATMASESRSRTQSWFKSGCNAFESKRPTSQPMSFWTEQDVLQYIYEYHIPICSAYGNVVFDINTNKYNTTGCSRTGCIFCGFGCHLEKSPTRFERLKETHPKQYDYCLNGGEFDENDIWKPNKNGLGMKYVFDKMNELYGDDFIKY